MADSSGARQTCVQYSLCLHPPFVAQCIPVTDRFRLELWPGTILADAESLDKLTPILNTNKRKGFNTGA